MLFTKISIPGIEKVKYLIALIKWMILYFYTKILLIYCMNLK